MSQRRPKSRDLRNPGDVKRKVQKKKFRKGINIIASRLDMQKIMAMGDALEELGNICHELNKDGE